MTMRARLLPAGGQRRLPDLPVAKTLGWGSALLVILITGCGMHSRGNVATHISGSAPSPAAVSTSTVTVSTGAPTSVTPTTSTTVPCPLTGGGETGQTVPVNPVCSAAGAPHFDTPQAAMTYLASAWNASNVKGIDYVTDPAGRKEMDSMASLMVNLQFKYCTENPAGDYTCYFSHNITPSTSPTTYPNPDNFPPGEAVFTVAPAGAPGWYLTNVIHCG
jgi:hypothetical protein